MESVTVYQWKRLAEIVEKNFSVDSNDESVLTGSASDSNDDSSSENLDEDLVWFGNFHSH